MWDHLTVRCDICMPSTMRIRGCIGLSRIKNAVFCAYIPGLPSPYQGVVCHCRLKSAMQLGLAVARVQSKALRQEGDASQVAHIAQDLTRCILRMHINPIRDGANLWFGGPWSAPLVLAHLLASCWVYNNMAACAWQQVTGERAVGDWSPVAWVSQQQELNMHHTGCAKCNI